MTASLLRPAPGLGPAMPYAPHPLFAGFVRAALQYRDRKGAQPSNVVPVRPSAKVESNG